MVQDRIKCEMSLFLLLVNLLAVVGQFTRETIYYSMNDRGVYLPDDYNADLPPAQVYRKSPPASFAG